MYQHSGGVLRRRAHEGEHGEGVPRGAVVGPHRVVVLNHRTGPGLVLRAVPHWTSGVADLKTKSYLSKTPIGHLHSSDPAIGFLGSWTRGYKYMPYNALQVYM